MDLVAPFSKKIDVEAIDSFSDASTFLVTLLHSKNIRTQWVPHSPKPSGDSLIDSLIHLIWEAERPMGVDQLIVMLHPLLYYRIQKDCRSVLEIQTHSSAKGYSGTILGHPFFSHARLRKNTMLVAAKSGENVSKLLVMSPKEWTRGDSLFT